MKTHNFEQRTEEWYAIRKGKMTASNAQTISANGKGLETYIYNLMAEKYSAFRPEGYVSSDMQRGIDLEDQARMTYELFNEAVETVGFIEHSDTIGCSPDGLVGEEGGLEVKCPNDTNYFKILVDGIKAVDAKYIWQVQMCLLITGRKWWDLCFYNVNFEDNIIIFRITPDFAKQEKLRVGIAKGELLINELTQKYEQRARNL